MLNYLSKLQKAVIILQEKLSISIFSQTFSEERPVLTIEFVNGLILYIRYNDFDEYSYQLNFSNRKFDRIRYDNYDQQWKVNTAPHHLHRRGEKDAVESPMKGDPNSDMLELVKIIKPFLS